MKMDTSKHNRRANWRDNMPPAEHRILMSDAMEIAGGNQSRLARLTGVTRAAVHQWLPPYRVDPYMPKERARLLIEHPEVGERVKEIMGQRTPAT
jgi:hypothetical protein